MDGGYFSDDEFEFADCRNIGTLTADLAESKFVRFLTKIETCIIEKGFSNFSDDIIKNLLQ